MARGHFRTSDRVCLYCGFSGRNNKIIMPYKIGKGPNKTYLCERCFNKTPHSKESNIEEYVNYIDKGIKSCPYCGGEQYYIKQSYKGTCNYILRFDEKEADNGHIHDNAEYKNTSKYAWCKDCNKRLFKLED